MFVLCTLGMGVVVVFFVIKSAFLSYGKPGPLLGISPDLAKFLRDHFAATVGLPLVGIVSLILILVLRETTGKLEFGGAWIRIPWRIRASRSLGALLSCDYAKH